MTTSPTKLQPPRLLLAPTPTQPTPIRSAASAAAHLAHEHNAPSDTTHPETQTILARSTASVSITSPTNLTESLPSDWCQLHLTGRRRSRTQHVPSVTSPTKLPQPPLRRTTMHQRTPARRYNFNATTGAGANSNADQTDQRHRKCRQTHCQPKYRKRCYH